jgi:hypothetical protein
MLQTPQEVLWCQRQESSRSRAVNNLRRPPERMLRSHTQGGRHRLQKSQQTLKHPSGES